MRLIFVEIHDFNFQVINVVAETEDNRPCPKRIRMEERNMVWAGLPRPVSFSYNTKSGDASTNNPEPTGYFVLKASVLKPFINLVIGSDRTWLERELTSALHVVSSGRAVAGYYRMAVCYSRKK